MNPNWLAIENIVPEILQHFLVLLSSMVDARIVRVTDMIAVPLLWLIAAQGSRHWTIQ
jgi:hypothetical protein